MKNKFLTPMIMSLLTWIGTLVILYFMPRLDIVSIFAALLLSLLISLLFYWHEKREESHVLEVIQDLTELLQSIECREERIVLEDDRFGVLRDEIYKSLVHQREKRDEAIHARVQLMRNMEDVTHQIKTPLTGISLLLELMETDPENAGEYLKRIQREIIRLQELSDLLLKLSSLDAGAVAFHKEPFSMKELLLDVELNLDYLLEEKEVKTSISGEDFMLNGDRVWIMQALINLTKNALEAVSRQGNVEYILKDNAIYQSITVKDDGPGITPEQKARIFERFYKANPGSKGFGIGLSLVKSIVQQHAGEVIVTSSKHGSTFELRFYLYK